MTDRVLVLAALAFLCAACDEPCGGCPSGQTCVGGTCQELAMCSPACTGGEVCLDGICRKAGLGEACVLHEDCADDPPMKCVTPASGVAGAVCARACQRHDDCADAGTPSCCACSDANASVCVPIAWGECPSQPTDADVFCVNPEDLRLDCYVFTRECTTRDDCDLFETPDCDWNQSFTERLCWPNKVEECGSPCAEGQPGCP